VKSKTKRHVGRPVSGVNKFRIDISMSFELNEKLSNYAKENKTTKSAIVEKSLNDFFSKTVA
jgi:macrodomain Ter protein organizer (MatP/YcbG family)